jgi:hypothetical protein
MKTELARGSSTEATSAAIATASPAELAAALDEI